MKCPIPFTLAIILSNLQLNYGNYKKRENDLNEMKNSAPNLEQ